MSTIYFLKTKKYDSVDFISDKHQVIPINNLQLLGVPRGSIIFTYEGSLLRTLSDQGHKIIYNPRNTLSPSVITDLSHIEYSRNVQYVGSELVKEYLSTYLAPLSVKWNSKFTWYDKDENISKIIDKKISSSIDYDLMLVTQSNINPFEYTKFLNDQDRNAKISVLLHPNVTQDHLDQIMITLEGSTVVNLGSVTRVSTGLRGYIDFITDRDYTRYLGKSSTVVVAPGQLSSELQVLNKKNKLGLELLKIPKYLLQNTNIKLSGDISDKFVKGKNLDYNLDYYHDPVLDSYSLAGSSEDHSKPYRDLLEEIINYYS